MYCLRSVMISVLNSEVYQCTCVHDLTHHDLTHMIAVSVLLASFSADCPLSDTSCFFLFFTLQ